MPVQLSGTDGLLAPSLSEVAGLLGVDGQEVMPGSGTDKDEQPPPTDGSECQLQTVYEGPPRCDCCINWVENYPDNLHTVIEQHPQTKRKALIVRMGKNHEAGKPLTLHSIVIQSQSLKATSCEVFEGYTGITLSLKNVVFHAPFRPFYYRWGWLSDVLEQQKTENRTAAQYTQLLSNVLEEALGDKKVEIEDLLNHRIITYTLLWALFEPGTYATNHISDQERFYIIDNSDRGRRFRDLCSFRYTAYSGLIRYYSGWYMKEKNIDDRIVIDAASYFNANPEDRLDLTPLSSNKRLPKINVDDKQRIGHKKKMSKEDYLDDLSSETSSVDSTGASYESENASSDEDNTDNKKLSDEHLLLCTPCVRGFALKHKIWAKFDINLIKDIHWNDGAFPELMLPSGYKDLVLSFVEGQAANKTAFDDVIKGKGLGVIMLFAGSPGTGKTLTAEAIADNIQRPLYILSAGELGNNPRGLEKELKGALELTEKWDAILLFDECDVFLQERSSSNLDHNQIVGIFLRLLEYYRGTMIMTTNRADAIDKAFQSRIHLTLHYPELFAPAKHEIWRRSIARSQAEAVLTDEMYDRLTQLRLNGRQIKNIVKTATLLSFQQKQKLGIEQIRTVLVGSGEVDADTTFLFPIGGRCRRHWLVVVVGVVITAVLLGVCSGRVPNGTLLSELGWGI
ncbi:P-loop containing nucleoside triphosphate hydrolase protein [Aspergillus multicolor]|uniref:ATP-binding protein n=1 Tax=Aspergillus multicolor TaxID=41759 RepID=UPI003CCD8B33